LSDTNTLAYSEKRVFHLDEGNADTNSSHGGDVLDDESLELGQAASSVDHLLGLNMKQKHAH
jgi:hypothetical protein